MGQGGRRSIGIAGAQGLWAGVVFISTFEKQLDSKRRIVAPQEFRATVAPFDGLFCFPAIEAEMARVEGRADLETFLQERTNRVPLGRRAEVSEVVDSILWLALDAPDYVTCARLNVSGGLDKD